jgi:DNA excision repair protein ERCC-2
MALELRPDQREVVKKLVNALSSAPWVALQAPTGWGKTVAVLAAIKELGLKPAIWFAPRLSIVMHIYTNALRLGLNVLATAGREKMCIMDFSMLDFIKGVCRNCQYNKPISNKALNELGKIGSVDFGKIKEVSETMGLCPYEVQGLLERFYDYDVIVSHYARAKKLARIKPRVVVVDESHHTVIPSMTSINARAIILFLERLGFNENDAWGLVRNPEALKAILNESIDALISMMEDDEKPLVETLITMLRMPIWYFDENENTLNALEIHEIPKDEGAKMVFLSATLPPQLLSGSNTVIIKRGWRMPAVIDARFNLSYENILRRKNEIQKHVEKYLTAGTIIYTTMSRETILELNDDVVWEDEIEGTPCETLQRKKIIVLRVYGRFNEGVDISCGRRIIILGVPLLPPAVMQRLEARGIDPKNFIVTVIVQLLGRGYRKATPPNPEELPEFILIDRRFLAFKEELEKYEYEVKII